MDAPTKDRPKSSFSIAVRPGTIAVLMPTECQLGEHDGFSLSSATEVRDMMHNLAAAAHLAFPDDFPDPGPMRGKVEWVNPVTDPDGLKN